MNVSTRQLVRERAGNRCEYCQLSQELSPLATLQVDHIIPRKHHGTDHPDNLALSCIDCNLHKGSDVAGYDPLTGALKELFHPRRHIWSDHFEWAGVLIIGRSDVGRTTVQVLQLNGEDRLQLRTVATRH
jgi:hypothetical protein